jgi:hypothetical protein
MLARLRTRSTGGTVVAIAAAYCLALQAILAAILLPQMQFRADAAPGDHLVICHSESTAGSGPAEPSDAARHAACAVCVQAHATVDAAPPRASLPAAAVAYAAYRLPTPAVHAAQRPHEPRSSQGPPQSA